MWPQGLRQPCCTSCNYNSQLSVSKKHGRRRVWGEAACAVMELSLNKASLHRLHWGASCPPASGVYRFCGMCRIAGAVRMFLLCGCSHGAIICSCGALAFVRSSATSQQLHFGWSGAKAGHARLVLMCVLSWPVLSKHLCTSQAGCAGLASVLSRCSRCTPAQQ
jgi:hypothetical protein